MGLKLELCTLNNVDATGAQKEDFNLHLMQLQKVQMLSASHPFDVTYSKVPNKLARLP